MQRTILHVDANCFYASVECLYSPSLKGKPVAVCGDPTMRHGIVLTATYEAKRLGVQVGMAVWQAKQLAPQLIVIPPNFSLYVHFSKLLHTLCKEYSPRVESFGLDECWIDLSAPDMNVEKGGVCADQLRKRIKEELGISVSIGVADNKAFAKLGSDYRKPDATTVIFPTKFQRQIYHLPVKDLLYVGPKTNKKLQEVGILTIGDLATAAPDFIKNTLGKNGMMIQSFALGNDRSPVASVDLDSSLKSIANSTTPPYDIQSVDDAKCVYYILAESVATRLRAQGVYAKTLSISVRTTELEHYSCQTTFATPTASTDDVAKTALRLFQKQFKHKLPLRSVGISCGKLLSTSSPMQLVLDASSYEKKEKFNNAIDSIRKRYGHGILQRGIILSNARFSSIDPTEESSLHSMFGPPSKR